MRGKSLRERPGSLNAAQLFLNPFASSEVEKWFALCQHFSTALETNGCLQIPDTHDRPA
jgi:hypothetical protein